MPVDVVKLLARAGHMAASADNSQSWKYVWDGQFLRLQYRELPFSDHSPPPGNTATLLAVGGAIENISQIGEALGLDLQPDIKFISTPPPASYASFLVKSPPRGPPAIGNHPLYHRHTNRFDYGKAPLPPSLLQMLSDMTEGTARVMVFDERALIRDVALLIRRASEVRFQVREAHEWLAQSLRFSAAEAAAGSGMDVRTLHLPPGGRLFLRMTRSWQVMSLLNRLGAHKFMARTDSAPILAAPALLAINAASGHSGAIEAGRLLTRAWIHLNGQGIAVHPYYVITDQLERLRAGSLPPALRGDVRSIAEVVAGQCGLQEAESLYMILRVGYPTRTAPRSKRVPLEQVFFDQSSVS